MKKNRIMIFVASATLFLALCFCLAACNGDPTGEATTNPPPDTGKEGGASSPDGTVTEDTTEPDPADVFKPDPERAVPKYDALMENLDTFPLYFKYDKTEYKGFEGFEKRTTRPKRSESERVS